MIVAGNWKYASKNKKKIESMRKIDVVRLSQKTYVGKKDLPVTESKKRRKQNQGM